MNLSEMSARQQGPLLGETEVLQVAQREIGQLIEIADARFAQAGNIWDQNALRAVRTFSGYLDGGIRIAEMSDGLAEFQVPIPAGSPRKIIAQSLVDTEAEAIEATRIVRGRERKEIFKPSKIPGLYVQGVMLRPTETQRDAEFFAEAVVGSAYVPQVRTST